MPETTNGTDDTTSVLIDVEAVRQQLISTLQTTETSELREKRRSVARVLDVLDSCSRVGSYVTSDQTWNPEASVFTYEGGLSVELSLYTKGADDVNEYAGKLIIHLEPGSRIEYTSTPRTITV